MAIKLPSVITSVLLRNVRAFERAGVGAAYLPNQLHALMTRMGGRAFIPRGS